MTANRSSRFDLKLSRDFSIFWFICLFLGMAAASRSFPLVHAAKAAVEEVEVIYVDFAATGANDGSSWQHAFTTLQAALDIASVGDEIWVARGTYLPTQLLDIADPASATFSIKSGVKLFGGFTGVETQRQQADWQANPTILSGDLEQNDVDINHDGMLSITETVGMNARHVLFALNITDPIEIDGFFIQSGFNNSGSGAGMYFENIKLVMRHMAVRFNHAVNGGGLYAYYCSTTLEQVNFLGNSAVIGDTGGGGGALIFGAIGSGLVLDGVTFDSNQAGYAGGGGLRAEHSWTVVINSSFVRNIAVSNFYITDPMGGGGMFVQSGDLFLADSIFQDNHATGAVVIGGEDIPERFIGKGGGLYIRQAGFEVVNVVFQDNSAAMGGGFFCNASGEGWVRDTSFIDNHAYYHGGGAQSDYISPHYENTIFMNNRAPYSGALGGWTSIRDSLFAYNHAYDPNPNDENYHGIGGALNGHVGNIFNSAFYANTADESGQDLAAWYVGKLVNVTMASGISCPSGSTLTIINSIIHEMDGNCGVTFANSLYGEVNVTSVTDGGGNLPGVDPLFVDSPGGNVRLQPASPAVDHGDTAQAIYQSDDPILVDLDGNRRIKNAAVDMGAYEYGAVLLNVALSGQGKVTSDPAWINCGSDCQQEFSYVYPLDYMVTLTAVSDPGWTFTSWDFASWDDQADTTKNPLPFHIHNDTEVIATFTRDEYTLVVNVEGSGTVTKNPDQATYHYGDEVTLTATANPGWTFAGWSGDVVSTANPLKVTMEGNTTISATFTRDEYTLVVNVVGSGTVSKNPDQATYHYGDEVTLTATANPGWTFAGWSGDVVSTANPLKITMAGNTTITATFTRDEYTLVVNVEGSGSVTKNPDQATYHYGDEVTLTATADPGWTFAGWSGDVVSEQNPLQVNITEGMNLLATFVSKQVVLLPLILK